jgi:hypothetical protein
MALKVRKSASRHWPVRVALQECDAAGVVNEVEQTFVAHFKPITEADRQALIDELDAACGASATAEAVLAEVRTIIGADGAGDARDVLMRVAAALRRMGDLTTEESLKRNAMYFERLVVGWGDEVRGEDDKPIPFSAEVLRELITGPDGNAISRGLIDADNQIRYGVAPRKNASTSPAPGANAEGSVGEAKTS